MIITATFGLKLSDIFTLLTLTQANLRAKNCLVECFFFKRTAAFVWNWPIYKQYADKQIPTESAQIQFCGAILSRMSLQNGQQLEQQILQCAGISNEKREKATHRIVFEE